MCGEVSHGAFDPTPRRERPYTTGIRTQFTEIRLNCIHLLFDAPIHLPFNPSTHLLEHPLDRVQLRTVSRLYDRRQPHVPHRLSTVTTRPVPYQRLDVRTDASGHRAPPLCPQTSSSRSTSIPSIPRRTSTAKSRYTHRYTNCTRCTTFTPRRPQTLRTIPRSPTRISSAKPTPYPNLTSASASARQSPPFSRTFVPLRPPSHEYHEAPSDCTPTSPAACTRCPTCS